MGLVRAKDSGSGWWLYCPFCGYRAYEGGRGYYLCGDSCGYFDSQRSIVNTINPLVNVSRVVVE